MPDDRAVPVTVLTGFLGAGKTTVLNQLLRRPELARTAVLVNELGTIPIDHHLVKDVRGDTTVLSSGCVCCTVSGDLVRALSELYGQVARAEIPAFERVLVETTGLADPTGVLSTLVQQPHVARAFRPSAVVTVVDAVAGVATLARHREAVAQVALADRLVLSKLDLVTCGARVELERAVRQINRSAPIVGSTRGDVEPEVLLAPAELARDVAIAIAAPPVPRGHEHDRHDHGAHRDVRTFTVVLGQPVRIGPLGLWLSLMTQMHGGALLRVKGIINVEGTDTPMVLHAVQHVVYPAQVLPAWPDEDRRTRLVFIARGLGAGAIEALRRGLADTLGQPLIEPAPGPEASSATP